MQNELKVHYRNLVAWGRNNPKGIVCSADLTSSCEADFFQKTFPDRFINFGVAEQNILSFAGGLAREGFIPLVHTFAVFIYRRAYDQIAVSIAYPNLPVILFGFLPGITTPGGMTHQAIEDISVMRSLPNMTVLEVGDATEIEAVIDTAVSVKGPVYIRMLRGEVKRLFPKSLSLKLNEPKELAKGSNLVVLSSGICTEDTILAVQTLKQCGFSIAHYHISTLKPFHCDFLLDTIAKSNYGVMTVENHSIIGGLGTIISEKMAENGINKKLVKLGIKDQFSHGASLTYLKKENGIDAYSIIKAIEKIASQSFNINTEDILKPEAIKHFDLSKVEEL